MICRSYFITGRLEEEVYGLRKFLVSSSVCILAVLLFRVLFSFGVGV